MSDRLRDAFDSEALPPGLDTRVRANVFARRARWGLWAAAVAAAAAGFFGYLYVSKMIEVNRILAAAEPGLASILRVGLRDHVYCAVMRKYKTAPPPVARLAEDLPVEMRGLAAVVQRNVPAQFAMHVAHVCKFKGRSYVHLAMHDGTRLISVMLTRREGGEALTRADLLTMTSAGGIDVFSGGSRGYDVSAFENGDWLVFLVSDLEPAESRSLMLALAPAVRGYLNRV
jgi:hypothetical protein